MLTGLDGTVVNAGVEPREIEDTDARIQKAHCRAMAEYHRAMASAFTEEEKRADESFER